MTTTTTTISMYLRSLEAIKTYGQAFFNRFTFNKEKAAKPLEITEVKFFKKQLEKYVDALIELEFITVGESNEITNDLLKRAKKAEAKIRKLVKDEDSTNDDLQELAHDLHQETVDSTPVIEYELTAKEVINQQVPIQKEVMESIARSFSSSRKGKDIHESGVSVFDINLQPNWNEGDYLLAFKHHMKSPYVHTFGTGDKVETCQTAREKGVERIAKGGIDRMSHNTFDIVLFLRDKFSFYGTDNEAWTLPELFDFRKVLDRKAVRSGGYVIFNLPYYKIPHFEARINLQLKVEEIFRTDDEMGNMIFVTTFKKADELSQNKLLKKAQRMPHKMPHYTEADAFYCNKGQLTLPELFDGNVRDERDYEAAFKNEVSSFHQIRDMFKPKETVLEFSNPLQKHRFGHIGGVAASGVANGIYDTHLFPDLVKEGFSHPHLLSFKIVKKDVRTKTMETVGDVECEVESWQKTHTIVMEALYQDGTIKEFLNTERTSEEDE